jgi:7-carboxy-7-deazaguanine synthase
MAERASGEFRMLVSEIFYSIQGEGELTGIPSVFVRTSGCNLRCSWCDTKYASWTPEGVEMSIEEIIAQVDEFGSRHVVVTGGEPMIAKGIHQLTVQLKDLGKHITIETAATVLPEGIPCDLA